LCSLVFLLKSFFFFQAEDGIRYRNVTGVQTCALPIFLRRKYFSTSRTYYWRIYITVDDVYLRGSHCFVGLYPTLLCTFLKSQYRSEEHTSELQSRFDIVCRRLCDKKKDLK